MPIRRSRPVLILIGLLVGGYAAISGCAATGNGGPGGVPAGAGATAVPLAAYAADLAAARYTDYAARPGRVVRDETAFEEMRQYLIRRYEGAPVASSVVSNGVVFDCVRQPADAATPPAAATSPAGSAPGAGQPGGSPPVPLVACPSGSTPVRRVTLDELIRFPTLAAFLGKGPGPEGLPPTGPPPS